MSLSLNGKSIFSIKCNNLTLYILNPSIYVIRLYKTLAEGPDVASENIKIKKSWKNILYKKKFWNNFEKKISIFFSLRHPEYVSYVLIPLSKKKKDFYT